MARITDSWKYYTSEERENLQKANTLYPEWQKKGREVARDIISYFVEEYALIDEYIILAKIAALKTEEKGK